MIHSAASAPKQINSPHKLQDQDCVCLKADDKESVSVNVCDSVLLFPSKLQRLEGLSVVLQVPTPVSSLGCLTWPVSDH